MRKQEVWTVISTTLRKKWVHVQLGSPVSDGDTIPRTGPTMIVDLEETPNIGDQVQITYVWGSDYSK